MKMTEIEREPITILEWSEPCVSLAAEAQEVLGYKLLATTQEKEPEKHSELALILAKAEIPVLNAEQVKLYQTELLKDRSIVAFNEWLKNPERMFWGPGWEKTEIAKYPLPIPEFVLNKAIQIKKLLPEVRIYVEHLSEHPDPFLIVATKHETYDFDGETFYVEVWEEPKFEGRLR